MLPTIIINSNVFKKSLKNNLNPKAYIFATIIIMNKIMKPKLSISKIYSSSVSIGYLYRANKSTFNNIIIETIEVKFSDCKNLDNLNLND